MKLSNIKAKMYCHINNLDCGRGYQRNEDYGTCTICPIATYSDRENSHTCFQCPHGYSTHQTGTTSRSDCYECKTYIIF